MTDPELPDAGPRPVAASLDHVTRALGMPSAAVLEAVFSQWPDLVGPTAAANARPSSLRGGVLVVTVDDPAWGSELRYRAQDILASIAGSVGRGSPTRMEVRVRSRSTRGRGSSVVNFAHRNSAP